MTSAMSASSAHCPARRGGTTATLLLYPQALAMGFYGLEFVMSNGGQWKVVGGCASGSPVNSCNAVPRPIDTVTTTSTTSNALSVTATTRANMISSPDNRYILTLSGNGNAYLYDGASDAYIANAFLFPATPTIEGYYPARSTPAPHSLTSPWAACSPTASLTVIGGYSGARRYRTGRLRNEWFRPQHLSLPFDSNNFVRMTSVPPCSPLTSPPPLPPTPGRHWNSSISPTVRHRFSLSLRKIPALRFSAAPPRATTSLRAPW